MSDQGQGQETVSQDTNQFLTKILVIDMTNDNHFKIKIDMTRKPIQHKTRQTRLYVNLAH